MGTRTITKRRYHVGGMTLLYRSTPRPENGWKPGIRNGVVGKPQPKPKARETASNSE